MKITAAKADSFVAKPSADVWAVLVYGPDRGLARERATGLLASFGVKSEDPFALDTLDEARLKAEPALLQDEMRALSFGGGARAVRVSVSSEAVSGAIASTLELLDSGALQPAARLLVEAGELSPRSKLRKAFEGAKQAAALPCYRDEAADLSRLADDTLAAAGVRLTDDARAALIPRLEGDRALARGALDTLVLYAGDQHEPLTLEDVDAVVVGAEPADLDRITTAVLQGDASGADAAYRRALDSGGAPVGVARALQRALARLATLHGAMADGARPDDAIGKLRPPVFGPRRAALKSQLRLWSRTSVDAAMARVFETERALKQSGAPDAVLCGRMVLALARMARR